MAKVYITSGTSWAGVATDGTNITIECIGGGGGAENGNKGGGGGEYASKSVSYTSESSVSGIQIGQGGKGVHSPDYVGTDGTETHWNTNVVIAKPGLKNGTGGTGGTGDTKYAGGAGGNAGYNSGGGGGAAGGANGAGGAGGAGSGAFNSSGGGGGGGNGGSAGSTGGVNYNAGGAGASGGGNGGDGSSTGGSSGGSGTNLGSTYGSGGGGGGGYYGYINGAGGLYGGGCGSGGAGYTSNQDGAQGIICITYNPPVVAPTLSTSSADQLYTYSVRGNGNITNTGGANCTRRGFCYKVGTSGDPTTSDNTAYDDGTYGTGAYTKTITGLIPNTTYRVRAYAVNSAGTGYGTTVSAITDQSGRMFLMFQ